VHFVTRGAVYHLGMRKIAVAALLFLLAFTASAQNDVGEVSFANSGAAAAQESFARGLALLHNFEYPYAAEAFRKAQELDPSFAMAYWGEAMTYTHPVWMQQNAEAARAALQRLGATPAERAAKAPTERERAYLGTLDILYGEGTKEERDFRYADAMAALHARFPDDVDATAFYALALLGTAHEGRDYAIYMRAAALLEEVFPSHLRHPGVLHYLIHSYDDPIHAPLGMRAARLYGPIAPNAGHALHMTSHIFLALGMWDDVVSANRRAIDVVNQQRAARSKPPASCGHYPEWLHYAYLQQHRFDDASKVLTACREVAFAEKFVAAGPMDTLHDRISSYATMRAQQLAGGGTLTGADAVSAPEGAEFDEARFGLAYGDLLAASKKGDVAAVKAAAERLHALQQHDPHAAMPHDMPMTAADRDRIAVMVQEGDALLLLANGKRAEAIPLLQAAAAKELAMPVDFGPPSIVKPAQELLAEQLLAAGRPADAAAAYRLALTRTPGRAVTLEGLAKAK
jgi:tetratricopeptide (TPR) repeat protein